MPFPFAGKVTVITGGAGGIGLAMARRFAEDRMKIVLTDVDETALAAASAVLRGGGADVLPMICDVAQPDEVDSLAAAAWDRFGGVHLLCNNAGVVPSGRARPVWDYAPEDWRWAFDVNLIGVVNGIRSFVPRMIAAGENAHIVNTASIAGLVSGPQSVVYSSSKHAVVRVTEALYASLREAGHPIGVTMLCPGLVDTAIYRSERNRPAHLVPVDGVALERTDLADAASKGLPPDTVVDMLYQAIIDRQFYVLTSSAYDGMIRDRFEALIARRNPTFVDVFTAGDHGPGVR